MAAIRDREFSHVIKQKLELAQMLAHKSNAFVKAGKITGIQKIEKKVIAEKSFLEATFHKATFSPSEIQDQHVLSSNLPHLEAILHVCDHAPGVCTVLQSFWYTPRDGCSEENVLVDVVACEGSSWVKVFARKRSALHMCWLGASQCSERPVTLLAEELVEASKQNQCRFQPPRIIFAFFDGITESIAGELCSLGVTVAGPVFPDDSTADAPSYGEVAATLNQTSVCGQWCGCCDTVNMDVSSLVAWSSLMVHGGAQYKFKNSILEQQAIDERATPILPLLEALTRGKKLVVCRTAFESFTSILETVGGPREKEIGSNLLRTMEVVADTPSERALKLQCSGKIKERSKVIFGTGDSMRATTLTANEGFVRAATNQGVQFDVVVHASRALSEMQQPK